MDANLPAHCQPPAFPARAQCATDQAQFFGKTTCDPIGSPCPAGEWPAVLPAGPTHYVLATAQPPSDGSMAHPFSTIGDAIAAAGAGDVIAIGTGTYSELVSIASDLTLIGTCVGQTTISPPPTAGRSALEAIGGKITVQDLHVLGGTENAAAYVGPGAQLSLNGTLLEGGTQATIFADAGAVLLGSSLAVRTATGFGGIVLDGARGDLGEVVIENAWPRGFFVLGGGQANVTGLAMRDILMTATEINGGSATLLHVSVEDAVTGAFSVTDGTLSATDAWDLQTAPRPINSYGAVIAVWGGARASFSELVAQVTYQVGAQVVQGGTLSIDRGKIEIAPIGFGVFGTDASRVVLTRSEVLGGSAGTVIQGVGAHGDLSDVLLRSSGHDLNNNNCQGALAVNPGASARARRIWIDDARFGIQLTESTLDLADFTAQRTPNGLGGWPQAACDHALTIGKNAQIVAQRVSIKDAVGLGVLATASSAASVSDLSVEINKLDPSPPSVLAAVTVVSGSSVTLTRVKLTNAPDVGLAVLSGLATITDLEISGTYSVQTGDAVIDFQAQTGALQPTLTLTRASLGSSAGVGIQLDTLYAQLSDVVVESPGASGIVLRGSADLKGVRVSGAVGYGVDASNTGMFENIKVLDTRGVANGSGGTGLLFRPHSSVRLDGVWTSSNAIAGVEIMAPSKVYFDNAVIANNPVGVELPPGSALSQFFSNAVVFEANALDVSAGP
jgi:hypothetical protein